MCLGSASESAYGYGIFKRVYAKKTLNYLMENCTPAKELPADLLYLSWGVLLILGDSSFRHTSTSLHSFNCPLILRAGEEERKAIKQLIAPLELC